MRDNNSNNIKQNNNDDNDIHSDTVFNYTNNNDNVPRKVKRVVVQAGVRIIKSNAFFRCSRLTSVTMPGSVTNIKLYAFYRCSSLASIIIPDSVTTIEGEAFSECSSLPSIIIPDSVTTIAYGVFSRCSSLASIIIPNSVTTIKGYAFSSCSSLASIIIPDSVTTIAEGAFSFCSSLGSIIIPDSITTIKQYSFRRCSSLASIIIPDSVTTIYPAAFSGCYSLASIIIPDSVTAIEYQAFYGCSSLASIALSDNVTTYSNGAFMECTLLDQRQSNGTNYHPDTQIWLEQRFANMPIHQVCYSNDTQQDNFHTNILTNLILQASNDTTLALTDAMGMTALHVLCCNPNATHDAIKLIKDAYPQAASMTNVAGMTPLMLLLQCKGLSYDELYVRRQTDGVPPLVRLLEVGVTNDVLEIILEAFDDENELVLSLDTIDEASGLLPFMQAAALGCCALDVVYTLASKRPDLLRG